MKNLKTIFFALFIIGAISFSSCSNDDEPDPNNEVTIEYRVTNSEAGRTADIEYTPENGIDVDLNDQPLPWSISFKAQVETGDDLNLNVEDIGGSGTMSAEILIDGVVVESESDNDVIVIVHLINL